MKELLLYIHGKGGDEQEAERYRTVVGGLAVKGFPYRAETPQQAREEFPLLFERIAASYERVFLVANSIGAYFAMSSLPQNRIKKAFLISPVVDMERLIFDRMKQEGITEAMLSEKQIIEIQGSEPLSFSYLCDVRKHPIHWRVPTDILYGQKDFLTPFSVISSFALDIGASLSVMKDGEHWFHTKEQCSFLDDWLRRCLFK